MSNNKPNKLSPRPPASLARQIQSVTVKGGTQAALAARDLIAAKTAGGEDLIDFMVEAYKGHIEGVYGKARLAAAEWLGYYVFGKPVETAVQIQMDAQAAQRPLAQLSDERLEELARGILATPRVIDVTPSKDEPVHAESGRGDGEGDEEDTDEQD